MAPSTKQRRSRARRRAAARCLAREVAAAAEERYVDVTIVVLLHAPPLALVWEVRHDGEFVGVDLAGPGAPWGAGEVARC